MCAVALAHYIWNSSYQLKINRCVVNVEYRNRFGEYRLNKYELSYFNEKPDRREFSVYVIRAGGGISCTLTVRRNTVQEGSEVELVHSQNHLSGLREVFRLLKSRIAEGRHYNSLLYKNFEGENAHPERTKIRLKTEVRQKNGVFVQVPYEVELTQIS